LRAAGFALVAALLLVDIAMVKIPQLLAVVYTGEATTSNSSRKADVKRLPLRRFFGRRGGPKSRLRELLSTNRNWRKTWGFAERTRCLAVSCPSPIVGSDPSRDNPAPALGVLRIRDEIRRIGFVPR
jgi:hypothetical protein